MLARFVPVLLFLVCTGALCAQAQQPVVKGTQRARGAGLASAVGNADAAGGFDLESTLALLPLESRQWESVAGLDSQANAAATAERAPGAAGDEDQEDNAQLARATSDAGAPATGLSFSGLQPCTTWRPSTGSRRSSSIAPARAALRLAARTAQQL